MKLLLDTCTFLWLTAKPERLSATARQLAENAEVSLVLSSVSSWEIAVKFSLGRLDLSDAPAIVVPAMRDLHGIDSLALDEESALRAAKLPSHHKDPFDRMLACQAMTHGLVVLTPDEMISRYVETMW